MYQKLRHLVNLIKKQDEIKQEIDKVKAELLPLLPVGFDKIIEGYEVVKRIKKVTVTNETILANKGLLPKVTVTVTKVDPALVKRIAEQEKYDDLFKTKEEIVVFRPENTNIA